MYYIYKNTLTGSSDALFPNDDICTLQFIDDDKKKAWLQTVPGYVERNIIVSANADSCVFCYLFDSLAAATNFNSEDMPDSVFLTATSKADRLAYFTAHGITLTSVVVPE